MDALSYKTEFLNKATIQKNWVVIDAKDAIVGRLSSQIAMILRGKHKPGYTPIVDCGDNVIVINSDHVRFTGKKFNEKVYIRHTGHPGGQRFSTPREEFAKGSGRVIEKAVRGMLPKTRLGRQIFGNLYIYPGTEHPHTAQQPVEVKIK